MHFACISRARTHTRIGAARDFRGRSTMDRKARTALVLGTIPDDYISHWNEAASAQWSFIQTPNVEAAEALLSSDSAIRVGLCPCPADGVEEHLEKFSTLRSRHRTVQWLALLPRSRLEEHRVAGHIAQYFFDFLSVPVEQHRLLASVGHAHGMSSLIERTIVQPQSANEEQMVGTS